MSSKGNRLLTSEELAELLALPPASVRRLAREGVLPFYRAGNLYRWSYEEVIRAMKPTHEEDTESESNIQP